MATREWNPWNAGSPLLQDAARFPQMASTQLACRECSMQFSGPTPYMDHLKSARHQKKVAAHRLLAEIAAGGAPVNSSPDVMTVDHSVRREAAVDADCCDALCLQAVRRGHELRRRHDRAH
ncbi:hypothetical protein HPB51_019807 [Rhipicephalus microplus]|uniref:C2H2-type domain-containing protein n=1 Tax=Rhipicephalus microplus TaxID=6941 RepID=A0A9J6EBF3_RHIMP|nr:hypothetical protein HPB51_019807 [Rhipicephalus microplus]